MIIFMKSISSELESFRENDLFITKTQEIVVFISETKVANAKKLKLILKMLICILKQQGFESCVYL